jgi:hypothetical protein
MQSKLNFLLRQGWHKTLQISKMSACCSLGYAKILTENVQMKCWTFYAKEIISRGILEFIISMSIFFS